MFIEFVNKEKYKNSIGIYAIINLQNGCVYIGQTYESFIRRFWHHSYKLNHKTHDNINLQNDWNKYCHDNFKFEIFEIVNRNDFNNKKELKQHLGKLEMYYIKIYKEKLCCYNIADGGKGKKGVSMPETAKKIVGSKNKLHMTGRKMSKETKLKMSKSQLKRPYVQYKKEDSLSDEEIIQIKQMLISGYKPSNISKKLNVKYKYINNILSSNSWKDIKVDGWDEFLQNRQTYKRLSKADHLEICKLYQNGMSKEELIAKYNKTRSCINKIIRDNLKKI